MSGAPIPVAAAHRAAAFDRGGEHPLAALLLCAAVGLRAAFGKRAAVGKFASSGRHWVAGWRLLRTDRMDCPDPPEAEHDTQTMGAVSNSLVRAEPDVDVADDLVRGCAPQRPSPAPTAVAALNDAAHLHATAPRRQKYAHHLVSAPRPHDAIITVGCHPEHPVTTALQDVSRYIHRVLDADLVHPARRLGVHHPRLDVPATARARHEQEAKRKFQRA